MAVHNTWYAFFKISDYWHRVTSLDGIQFAENLMKWMPSKAKLNITHFEIIPARDLHINIFLFWLNFTNICSQWSIQQYAFIGSDIRWAPNRWQTITWTNNDIIHWRIYASLGRPEWLWNLDSTLSSKRQEGYGIIHRQKPRTDHSTIHSL